MVRILSRTSLLLFFRDALAPAMQVPLLRVAIFNRTHCITMYLQTVIMIAIINLIMILKITMIMIVAIVIMISQLKEAKKGS